MATIKPNDLWLTPRHILDAILYDPHIPWTNWSDMATTADNPGKFHRFFTPNVGAGSLEIEWPEYCFVNWPYSQNKLWLKKADYEARRGAIVVGLGPLACLANQQTRDYLENARIIILGRVKFEPPATLLEYRKERGLAGNPESPRNDVALYLWNTPITYNDRLSQVLKRKIWA